MIPNLDVLVVDDRPETIRFLTEFLVQRCRRVDVAASVKEAVTAVIRRRTAGERYHLVISDFAMPIADGLSLLRDLRNRQDDVPFVFVTGYRALNPNFEPEAKRLGALAILDKPVDLRQLEQLIDQATATFRRQAEEKAGDQPFFGTSRMYRKPMAQPPAPPAASEALEPRVKQPPPSTPGTSTYLASAISTGSDALEPTRTPPPPPPAPIAVPPPAPVAPPLSGYQRRPSGLVPIGTGTTRLRRSVDPGSPPPPPGSGGTGRITRTFTPQPPTSFTTRARRGVEGTTGFHNPNARTESGRMATCSQCARQFLVATKAESFVTVCVHCGQLQRIDPA